MGKNAPDTSPLTRCNFVCSGCRSKFESEPGRVEDAPDREAHPHRYFATCPNCGSEAAQAAWEQALLVAWRKATGPRTAEGKARTAANLEGHPTPEEAQRTRFNAMKHGLFAEVATYYPAKPGKYPHCSGCEYLETVCQEQVACLKRTELFMKHHIAFETKDPSLLNRLRANLHANVQAIIDDIILAIIREGVQLKSPRWYYDQNGFHLAEYTDSEGARRLIYEINAHPLLKTLGDFLAKNNLSLADMGMTPKGQDDTAIELGNLQRQSQDRETMDQYQHRQTKALEDLRGMIERSREKIGRDPILIEHGGGEDG